MALMGVLGEKERVKYDTLAAKNVGPLDTSPIVSNFLFTVVEKEH